MGSVLGDFLSPEAGQRRRQWLNSVDNRISDTLAYYLGPQLAPSVEAAASLGQILSPGADVVDAYQASGDLVAPGRSAWDRAAAGATLAGALGAMAMPGGVSSLRQGIDDVVDAGVREARSPTLGSNAGNVAAEATTETPAQNIARLLREGRGAEVTDELYARADPQELNALYNAGATGADMPFSEALDRARAGGFDVDTPLYHGTEDDFQAFELAASGKTDDGWYGRGVYSSADPDLASAYGESGQVLPIWTRGKQFDVDQSTVIGALDTRDELARLGIAANVPMDTAESHRVGNLLRDRGVENINVNVDMEDLQQFANERVTFDPANIRSRFARFDPRLSHLRNLSAGVAGAATLGAALGMQPSTADASVREREKRTLQEYLQ